MTPSDREREEESMRQAFVLHHEAGFREGLEAAAEAIRKVHDETMKWRAENAKNHGWQERGSQDALERMAALHVAETAIRALSPPSSAPTGALRDFLDLYIRTYMRTDHHPTILEEANVMNLARELEWQTKSTA